VKTGVALIALALLSGQASAADLALRGRPTLRSPSVQRAMPPVQLHERLYLQFRRWLDRR
jgi:hypothetical protein